MFDLGQLGDNRSQAKEAALAVRSTKCMMCTRIASVGIALQVNSPSSWRWTTQLLLSDDELEIAQQAQTNRRAVQ